MDAVDASTAGNEAVKAVLGEAPVGGECRVGLSRMGPSTNTVNENSGCLYAQLHAQVLFFLFSSCTAIIAIIVGTITLVIIVAMVVWFW